ncbi:helix-turn-helix domain-containing protein [Halomonas mongoliensis]|uniref:helix-turn-helix domain-containing protein n=1 Tax=Halomonas mongoliensis TaxID=321265 RepID=UPI00403ABA16
MQISSHRLRQTRLAKRLSQKELADLLDMDQTHISRAEKGERGLTADQLRLAAKVLGVSTDYLLGTDINEHQTTYRSAETSPEQRRLLTDYTAPVGLRELATELDLVKTLRITEDEWHALSSMSLPGQVSRDGYVQLLFTIRAICE